VKSSSHTPDGPSPTLLPYTTLFRSTGPPAWGPPRDTGRAPRAAAVPCPGRRPPYGRPGGAARRGGRRTAARPRARRPGAAPGGRSEEHTSELQSRETLVCRLLLEKK